MRRSDVVKGVWAYLKANNLQDPKKKQFYFLDGPLKKIFGSSKTKFKVFIKKIFFNFKKGFWNDG
jgi:chromatin remodeling complex protein RSC6